MSFRRLRYAGEIAALLGAIMIAWILVQASLINSGPGISWLQPFYFLVGLTEAAWGLWLRRRQVETTPR